MSLSRDFADVGRPSHTRYGTSWVRGDPGGNRLAPSARDRESAAVERSVGCKTKLIGYARIRSELGFLLPRRLRNAPQRPRSQTARRGLLGEAHAGAGAGLAEQGAGGSEGGARAAGAESVQQLAPPEHTGTVGAGRGRGAGSRRRGVCAGGSEAADGAGAGADRGEAAEDAPGQGGGKASRSPGPAQGRAWA